MTTETNPPPQPAADSPPDVESTNVSSAQQQSAQPVTHSPSPPASPVQPNVTSSERAPQAQTAQETQDVPTDPRLAALHAMFPDFDDALLLSVLESVGGDQDRAVDVLLGMSDPEYQAEAAHPQPGQTPMSQTELDEQFARQLMLQDQQEDQEAWQAVHQQPPQHGGYEPYIPGRRSRSPTWAPQQRQPQESGGNLNETVAEFQQQFNRIAETGKKSFGTLFSKVKAKWNELDNPSTSRPETGASSVSPPPQNYDAPRHSSDWIEQQQRQGFYFDPGTPAPPPRPTNASPTPILPPIIPPPTTSPPAAGPETPTASSPPPRPKTPIDTGRVGLLPKRPVSLIRPPEDNNPPPIQRHDSDDTLEYAENPFEEGSRR